MIMMTELRARKVGFGIVALGIFVGLIGSIQVFAAGSNLVPNGDLETVSSTSTTTPQGWATDYWGTLTPVFTYPVAGKSGGKAVQVQITKSTPGDEKWYFTHIPVTPGTTYQLSDDYNSTVASNVTVEFKSSTGAFSYALVADLPSSA